MRLLCHYYHDGSRGIHLIPDIKSPRRRSALYRPQQFRIQKGLTVTTFYLAKGLEFDQVFGVFQDAGNPMLNQAKYICATRALHELYMYQITE